jgi:hypothetical protein
MKVRRAFWIDEKLLLMMSDKGIEMSSFINMAMSSFLELPEDPTVKLLRENLESSMIRLRISYLNGIRDRITETDQAQSEEDLKKAKQKELTQKLMDLGKKLQRTSCYPKILQALKDLDSEAWCWDTALREINSMNGDHYGALELWNNAIDWYRKCPVPQP